MSVRREVKDLFGDTGKSDSVEKIDKIPSITKEDFNRLNESSLDRYMDTIPNQEWHRIVKALLLGISTSALSSLIYAMGQYTQWLKDNDKKTKVRATDDAFSSRAGAAVGRGVGKVIETVSERDLLAPFKRKSKQISNAIRAGINAFKSKPPKSVGQKLKEFSDSIKSFKRLK